MRCPTVPVSTARRAAPPSHQSRGSDRRRGGRRGGALLVGASGAPPREPAREQHPVHITRRELAGSVVAASTLSALLPAQCKAFEVKDLGSDAQATRQQLLDCIAQGGGEEDVQAALEMLSKFNPTPGAAKSELLQGNWRLLWSSQGAEVSKAAKNFPLPFTGMQLIGPTGGTGEPGGPIPAGRAANIVKVLGGGITLKASGAAVPDESNADDVIFGPPFRLELVVGGNSIQLQGVETTESKTTSLLGNNLNTFTQLYMESTGKPGDLRLSRVTTGDAVVLGSTFVHVRV